VEFFLFNSAPHVQNVECEDRGKRLLCHLLQQNKWKETEKQEINKLQHSLIQKDSSSCGLFVCYYGEMLGLGGNLLLELGSFNLVEYKSKIIQFLKEAEKANPSPSKLETSEDEEVELLQNLKGSTNDKTEEDQQYTFFPRGVEVRESKLVKGEMGLFAVEEIKKDELFLEMKGEIINRSQFQKRFKSTL
jgi:hypothetical protein